MVFPSRSHIYEAMTRRKPLDQREVQYTPSTPGGRHERVGLRRTLTLTDLILYGVGCSVGAGIYALIGLGANLAGPAVSLSFLLCGVACVFTSLSYAEFAARIPLTGSAYVYAYVAFGEFLAWLVGWSLTLNYAFSASVVARAWAEYLAAFLRGLSWFADDGLGWLTRWEVPLPLVGADSGYAYTCSPLSMVIVALCTLVLVMGAKESSNFNNAMTALNMSILALVVTAGICSGTVDVGDNLTPFAPEGMSGVLRGSGLVFFAFIGFDMVACLSEEVKRPERNMPLGIVGTLAATTSIYVLVSVVVIGMAPFSLLGGDVPIVNALLANGCCTHEEQLEDGAAAHCLDPSCFDPHRPLLLYGSHLVSFGAIFGLTTGTFTSLMGQPRIFYRMAMDGLLFKVFARVSEETQVPTQGIVITGIMCAALACFVELEALGNLVSLGTLAVFTFVNAGVIILRMRPSEGHSSLDKIKETERQGEDEPTCPSIRSRCLPKSVSANGSLPAALTTLFASASVVASMAYNNGYGTVCSIIGAALAAAFAAVLFLLPMSPPPKTFRCPLVPLVPLLGLGCNGYMMGSLPLSSWSFLFVWLLIGLAVYFSYGIHNSILGKRPTWETRARGAPSEVSPLLVPPAAGAGANVVSSPFPPTPQMYDKALHLSIPPLHGSTHEHKT